MITFKASNEEDVPQIEAWADADIYHKDQHNAPWWITGNGLLSFRIDDGKGPVFYVRIDDGDGGYARLSVQFDPIEVVPKVRLVRAMLQTLPKLITGVKDQGYKGLVFDSESPSLIAFMSREGFEEVGDGGYKLTFGE